ncbi:TraI/MobA(P) family conjugative relaxase [Pseudomonas sp. AB12(2023)]|uniref:TraI/MobA(P) family conjugative relaxase n=1 Tax=Pseudomonas sp. AB12(2023) TaxID=3048597 RepID=UPI002B22602C|nr:TraI/MobA(P) family conjugative relaxase [Pseudomonas sp. AB12(2023)]MEB0222086.1 relaxase/mobilization nuclease domain-containing protein [Pseudomonas sp. AB12(2023)]
MLAHLVGGANQTITLSGVACQHNCLSLQSASAEMESVAAQNVRVKDPVYHVVLSWAPGEKPTDVEAFNSAHHALSAVGMSDHQYVFAVHRDTENVHVHMAVNRVNPDTFKAVYPERDFYKLDRAMRELELENGWQQVQGVYSIFERDGKQVIDWTSNSPDSKGKKPSKAAEMERYDGSESFHSYIRNEPRKAIGAALKRENMTWQAIHHLLAKFHLELREKGQGFAIYDLGSEITTPIKASDLHEDFSKSRLEKRLGTYQGPLPVAVASVSTYDKMKSPKRDPLLREERRLERAIARRKLRTQYQDYKKTVVYQRLDPAAVKKRFSVIAVAAKEKRAEVKNSRGTTAVKKAMYSVIAFETLRDRERLKTEIQQERDALRNDPMNKTLPFRKWVEDKAASGDSAAISQLRGWAYSEKRLAAEIRSTENDAALNGVRHEESADPIAKVLSDELIFRVRRNGAVHYQDRKGNEQFVDHGRAIHMHAAVCMDKAAISSALLLAKEKYAGSFELTGSEEFKRIAIEVLTEYKIKVVLKDPSQEALRIAAESAAKASEGKAAGRPRNQA